MTLYGENLRILQKVNSSDFQVIAKATNCTIQLTSNTDESNTKDDVGMFNKPTMNGLAWSVNVESLDVLDISSLLAKVKEGYQFTLLWDEVSTTDNQTPLSANFARTGTAFLTDLTVNWNNRENSAKSIQFTGSGPLSTPSSNTPIIPVNANGTYLKGQRVRFFFTDSPNVVIAAALSLSLHVSVTVEQVTTKDTDDNWQIQEPTGIAYDISTSALVRSGETITSTTPSATLNDIEDTWRSGTPMSFFIKQTGTPNNRGDDPQYPHILDGKVIITSLNIQSPNRQRATYEAQMVGYGPYTVPTT